MAKAFISYASQDEEVSLRICSFLEARGIRCWVAPRDVRPGRRYGEEIVPAIGNADAVVLVLSENANSSTFVEREIERPSPRAYRRACLNRRSPALSKAAHMQIRRDSY